MFGYFATVKSRSSTMRPVGVDALVRTRILYEAAAFGRALITGVRVCSSMTVTSEGSVTSTCAGGLGGTVRMIRFPSDRHRLIDNIRAVLRRVQNRRRGRGHGRLDSVAVRPVGEERGLGVVIAVDRSSH